MKRTWLKILLAVPLSLLLLAAATWGTLLHTTLGAGLLLDAARPYIPGRLEYRSMTGSIAGGLEFTDLEYGDDAGSARAVSARLALVPEFRPLVLRIRFLDFEGLRYTRRASVDDEAGPLPESLALPFRIEVERLKVDGLDVLGVDGKQLFGADRLEASLVAHEQLELRDVRVESPMGSLKASGRLHLARPYTTDIEATARLAIQPGEWLEPLRVDTQLRLGGSTDAYVLDFDGTAASGGLGLVADGRLDLAARTVAGQLEWTDFSWPLDAVEPRIRSQAGSVIAAGTFDDWTVRGEAEVESPGLPGGTLVFDAAGDRERLAAQIVEGRFLGGTLAGEASFSWVDHRPFDLSLRVDHVATGPLYPELPSVISGDFAAGGQLEPLVVAVDIERVEGELKGYEMSLSGHASYRPGELGFRAFDITAGESSLRLDGSLDREEGIEFIADIRDLGAFVAETAGRFEAQGRLALRDNRPRLDLDLQGRDLSWRNISLPVVSVSDRQSALPGSMAALSLDLQSPAIGARSFDRLLLDVDFSESRQDLTFALGSGVNTVSASLSGQVADLDAPPAEWRWSGELTGLEIDSDGNPVVKLARPAALELAAARAQLEPACMVAGKDSRMCLDGRWSRDNGIAAKLVLERAPLMLLAPFLGQEVEFTQQAQGELQFEMDPAGDYSGAADIHLSPGVLKYPDDPEPILQTGPGVVGFRLVNGGLEAGNLNIPLPGQGEIDLDFRMPDLAEGLDSEVLGRLRISLDDLDVLSTFLPIADEISGRLEADLKLAGTAERPYSSGLIALSDGVIANRVSGLRLSEIQLSGQMEGNGLTEMQGSFRATEGSGRLDALVDLSDFLSPRVVLGIQGAGLKLFDSKDLAVTADPDLRLEWKSGAMHVDGSITVPSARVAPAVIPAQTVSESEDVRVVAGKLPGADPVGRKNSRISVFGNLDLVLGDRVEVVLDVADVSVSGRVRFNWQGGLVPQADGSFVTSGEILAFGQLLEITEGKVLFPNVPANDPHLNIQAEREIFGNSEIRRAGLLISGTLRRPVMEPYTDPMTNRDRAQTLLITGSDFNMERGVGAVNIGTYIAPRIFVSYGLGVFEDENVISVRYDLGRGWGVKATSGDRQTGVDISYTVDQ